MSAPDGTDEYVVVLVVGATQLVVSTSREEWLGKRWKNLVLKLTTKDGLRVVPLSRTSKTTFVATD